jgi:hypothetical protein
MCGFIGTPVLYVTPAKESSSIPTKYNASKIPDKESSSIPTKYNASKIPDKESSSILKRRYLRFLIGNHPAF